jgi:outer membrane protein OmpA-like peptidoglycan-associated protein
LSLRRAENVAAALERAGVSAQLLNVQSRGATAAPIAAAGGRRVEVMLRG